MGFHFALQKHIIEQRLLEENYSEEESEAMQRAIKVLEGLLAICRRIREERDAERRLERARQLLAQPQLTLPVVPAGDAAVSEESEVLRGQGA